LDEGFPCGELDRDLFNFLFQDAQQAINALSLRSANADIPVYGWQSAPPSSPAVGDRYVVLPTGSGAWGGFDNQIAMWTGTEWAFAAPVAGLQVQYWSGRQIVLRYDGSTWAEWGPFVRLGGDNMTGTLVLPRIKINDGSSGEVDINGNTIEIAGPGQSFDFKNTIEEDFLVRIGRNSYRLAITTASGQYQGDIVVSSDHAAAGARGLIALAADAGDAANNSEAVTPAAARVTYLRKSGGTMTGDLYAPRIVVNSGNGLVDINGNTIEIAGPGQSLDFKDQVEQDYLVRLRRLAGSMRLSVVTSDGTAQGEVVVSSDLATTAKDGLVKRATAAEVTSRSGTGVVSPIDLPRSSSVSFPTAGTFSWVVPAGVLVIRAKVWGAGGGGGASNNDDSSGSGGGGGGYAEGRIAVTPGQTLTIIVGAEGVGGVPGVSAPTQGGASSVAGTIAATGGAVGSGSSAGPAAFGGAGGSGSGGEIAINGRAGGNGIPLTTGRQMGGFGGATYAGSPAGPNVTAAGQPGAFPGGGGAGSSTNAAGGNGARGLVIIEY
jgi:hypothetical protein